MNSTIIQNFSKQNCHTRWANIGMTSKSMSNRPNLSYRGTEKNRQIRSIIKVLSLFCLIYASWVFVISLYSLYQKLFSFSWSNQTKTSSIVASHLCKLHHDTANYTWQLVLIIFSHPPYSSDVAPYFLFPKLKRIWMNDVFANIDEI